MSSDSTNNEKFPNDMPIPKRSWKQRLLAIGIILLLLAAGLFIAKRMMDTKPKATRKPPQKMQALVSAVKITTVSTNVTVKALGRVIPAQEISIQSQVSGTVVSLHPNFTPGGIINKGEILVRLDDTDYLLALQQKQNILSQARADLRIEEGNQIVARQEWDLISNEISDIDRSSEGLVLRKPQMDKVKANIDSAVTGVEQARVNLERTVITAPFNGLVREKKIDLGSQVNTQSSIGVLTGTDAFWAEVSIPVEQLEWIHLPRKDNPGSEVGIYANGVTPHQGHIVRLLADVDNDGLMARLLLAVADPMGIESRKSPILLGSFIRAEIIGKRLTDVFQVDRASVLEGNSVLTVAENNTLHIQPVSIIWQDTDHVFIDGGLQSGDMVIVSNVPAPIEGMPLITNGANAGEKTSTSKRDSNERP